MNTEQNARRLRNIVLATILIFTPCTAQAQDCWNSEPGVAPVRGACASPACGYGQQVGLRGILQDCSWESRWLGGYAGVFFSSGAAAALIDRPVGDHFIVDHGGANVGGVLGCNIGCSPRSADSGWMWGAELAITGLDGRTVENDATFGDVRLKGSWLASLQVRGGYAWKNTFLYGTTGPALSDVNAMAATDSGDAVRGGWAFGVGLEHKLQRDWSARVDLLGYTFGDKEPLLSGSRRKVGLGAGQLRVGVIRKF